MAKLKHGDRVYINNKAGVVQYASTHEADVTWDNGMCTTVSTDDLLTEQEWHAARICICPPDHSPGHKERCPQYMRPRPKESTVVELHAGDTVLVCFGSAFVDGEVTRIHKMLSEKMPGIDWGFIADVNGILIKRGNDEANETGGGS